jgi:membrane protein YdbS with pleckstrin-like domain
MIKHKQNKSSQRTKTVSRIKGRNLPFKIRQTLVILVLRLLLTLGVGLRLSFFFLQLRLPVKLLGLSVSPVTRGLLVFIFMTLTLLVSIYLLFRWWRNYYLVGEEKVTHREGIFWVRRKAVRFPTLHYLSLQQSLIGRIFNFGTILLRSSETREEIQLKKIPRPQYYLDLFKKLFPEAEMY